MRSITPTVSHGDSFSIGQLADRWDKSPEFVKSLIENADLAVDERGLMTNTVLREFYIQHGTELD